jgi:hypothetical protein
MMAVEEKSQLSRWKTNKELKPVKIQTKHMRLFFALAIVLSMCDFNIASDMQTVILEDIDSGTTSPTGQYRWLDVADQPYSASYRDNYNYTQA